MTAALGREWRVVRALAQRSVRIQLRRAQLLMPTFMLPLVLLAVIASGTSAGTKLRGFPEVESFVAFVLPGTLMQGALILGLTSGAALAGDIEFGFFDRLLTAPVRRGSIVLGRLAGTAVLALIQATVFVAIALAVGASFDGGVAGTVAAIALVGLASIGLGGLAAAIALRTGSLAMMQSLFPLVFMLLFTAPAFYPRDLLTPVLRDIAAFNPLTYVVEAVRSLLIGDTSLGDPLVGVAAALGMAVGATVLATLALSRRIAKA